MNPLKFLKKSQRPVALGSPFAKEGLETHLDGRLLVVKDPASAEYMSVDFPISLWHDVDPSMQILVVTSTQFLAREYAGLSDRNEKPCDTRRTRNCLNNVEGGRIYYGHIGMGSAGMRHHLAILSDPLGAVPEAFTLKWIRKDLPSRLHLKGPIR